MSTADSKDGATPNDADATDATAPTMDSGQRAQARSSAYSGDDTELAPAGGTGQTTVSGRPSVSPDEIIGTILSERYQVTAKIGQGGMGAVYEARHTLIGKRVALKVLLDKHADKEQVVARLKQEARLASSIGHDNIVDITDFGTTNTGRTFVVMEYLDGESLGAMIARQGRLEGSRIVDIATQIASALDAAHQKGIVHRDIKPDNIFLIKRDGRDFVKVVDFGISKSMSPEENDDVRLTQTGMVLGTPLYMSPEQAQGEDDLDHRIDIYALGVIMYEAVTGEVPFRGKNYLNILTQVIGDEPTRPSELIPNIDRDLESVILKSMAKDREQRYQSMSGFYDDLKALADPDVRSTGARITAARWRKRQDRRSKRSYIAWLGGAVGIAAISTIAVTMLMGSESKPAKQTRPQRRAALATDAAVARVVDKADAAPQEPAFVQAHIQLVSTPPGAAVYNGGRLVCAATPCPYDPPMTREQIELHVVLDGYKRTEAHITPEIDDGATVTILLEPIDDKPTHTPKGHRNNGDTNKTETTGDKDPASESGDLNPNPHRRASE